MRRLAYIQLVADKRDMDEEPISAEGVLGKVLGSLIINMFIAGLMLL